MSTPASSPPLSQAHAALDAAVRGAALRRRVFGHAGVTIGAAVLIVVVLVALFAPVLAPYDPLSQDLEQRVIPPIWHEKGTFEHPLGTDQFGRDYFSRLLYGARISLLIRRATFGL